MVEDYPAKSAEDDNRRLARLRESLAEGTSISQRQEYRIGTHDLLEINVFEAPELNRSLRVSAGGEISMPLIGQVQVGALTAREIEDVLESRLNDFMNAPHVGVFVSAMESHAVSVAGAVKKPGVFQLRESKSLIEMISLAEGLADDAGDTVTIMRATGLSSSSEAVAGSAAVPANDASHNQETVHVNLRDLLESGDPRFNLPVYPGDIVKIAPAGIIYVVGEVKKPGGYVIKGSGKMSVLKAIAMAEGLTATSAKSRTRIIRTDSRSGQRTEISINLEKILAEKAPDQELMPADIVFVPNSTGKAALYRGTEAVLSIVSGVIIFHR
jgi:polysaccharide export outer membrane protein